MAAITAENHSDLSSPTVPNLKIKSLFNDFREASVSRLRNITASPVVSGEIANTPNLLSEDLSRTVNTCKDESYKVPAKSKRIQIYFRIMLDQTGENVTINTRKDSLLLLEKIPDGITLPSVGFGHGEITFDWHSPIGAVTVSVEGDGLIGYALKKNGRFIPGKGPEDLSIDGLPHDLLSYLEKYFSEQ